MKTEAIADERRLIAYLASMGDADANDRLEALKRQGAEVSSEIETLEFAVNVARDKLHTAEQTQAAEVERENKKKMLKRAEALRSSAAQLDDDAAKLVERYNRFLREATAMGLVRLHPDLVRVGSRRSLSAHFQQTGFCIERLAPSEKKTFSNLAQAWTTELDR